MTKPVWRKVEVVTVDAEKGRPWVAGIEFVSGPRQLRFRTVKGVGDSDSTQPDPGAWKLSSEVSCTADGVLPPTSEKRLLDTAPRGALICKIGGSLVDLPVDSSLTGTDPAIDKWAGRKVVAIGSFAVVPLDKDAGPIFFAINDAVDGSGHSGTLTVLIEDAVL